jgi:hypothetical protein
MPSPKPPRQLPSAEAAGSPLAQAGTVLPEPAEDVALRRGNPIRKTKPEALSPEALTLLSVMDPKTVADGILKDFKAGRTDAQIREVMARVDQSGIDRMVIAALGTDRIAELLGVDQKLAECLRKAKPEMEPSGLLILRATVEFIAVTHPSRKNFPKSFPYIRKVEGHLDFRFAEGVSFPNLEEVRGNVLCYFARSISFPSLRSARAIGATDAAKGSLHLPAIEALPGFLNVPLGKDSPFTPETKTALRRILLSKLAELDEPE